MPDADRLNVIDFDMDGSDESEEVLERENDGSPDNDVEGESDSDADDDDVTVLLNVDEVDCVGDPTLFDIVLETLSEKDVVIDGECDSVGSLEAVTDSDGLIDFENEGSEVTDLVNERSFV